MKRTVLEESLHKSILREKSLALHDDVLRVQAQILDGLSSPGAPPPKGLLIQCLREMYQLSTIAARQENAGVRLFLTVQFNLLVAYIESDGNLDVAAFLERITPALATLSEKTRASVERMFKEEGVL